MKLKPFLIIILVPSLIFGSIVSYNFYTDYKKLGTYEAGWSRYSKIKSQEVDKPDNLIGIILHQIPSIVGNKHSPKSYPVVMETYCQDVYAKYIFLMPWGEVDEIWVNTQQWAFTK